VAGDIGEGRPELQTAQFVIGLLLGFGTEGVKRQMFTRGGSRQRNIKREEGHRCW
jgi:hypothetical protein